MVYRITEGLGLLFLGLNLIGLAIPSMITAVLLVIAGCALLAGL